MKITIATLAIAASYANAGLTYQSQDRSITAGAYLPSGQQTEAINSNGFDDFDETLAQTFFDNQSGSASGFASQVSSLHQFGMTASGTAGGMDGPPAGSSSGFGFSRFKVEFILDQAAEYTLDFNYFADISSYSFTGASLNLGGSDVFVNISDSGILQAGAYSFTIDFGVSSAFVSGSFNFDFQIVPAPASAGLLAIGLLTATRRRRG